MFFSRGIMTTLTPAEAKNKVLRYCAYQERSHKEVRNKLYEFGLHTAAVNEMISWLISEGFVNEERYAKSFAGGKFRMKKWGRLKIIRELERHDLTSNCIKIGLKEINEEDYLDALREIIAKKQDLVEQPNLFARRDKIARYAIQKGYEPDLVWQEVKRLLPD